MRVVTKWTPDELAMLRAMYADTCTAELAQAIGRSKSALRWKAMKLGILKSNEYMQSSKSGRRQVGVKNPSTKKKSTRADGYPNPDQPIGSTRVTWHGVLCIKVTNADIDYYAKWQPMHKVVWARANGPVPKGHVVVFKAGCKTTDPRLITPDKVECITRHEHAKRNSPQSLQPEIYELVKLKAQINRRVVEIKRKANGND